MVAALATVSAVGTLIVAVITLVLNRKVKEVHVLVNARMTMVLEYLRAAQDKIATSRESGQPVPPNGDEKDVEGL